MWFTKEMFALCSELRTWGIEPRFETGDVVARGFADLGFEEFQVLPGRKILSLSAGTSAGLPEEHVHHFFWIPSVDETIALLERNGVSSCDCQRVERRHWTVSVKYLENVIEQKAPNLHEALARVLLDLRRTLHQNSSGAQ